VSTLDLRTAAVAHPATRSRLGALRGSLLAAGTAISIVGGALLVLLTPLYLHAAHDLANSAAFLDYPRAETLAISDLTVRELLLGPGTFAIATPDGTPFYEASEASHLRDARLVLYGFLLVALIGAVFTLTSLLRQRRDPEAWRAVGRGAAALAVGLAVVGLLFALTFEVMFELFHRIVFPGGNWAFDPGTQRLVQLYPIPFWQLTVGALAALAIGSGLLVWWVARRRTRSLAAASFGAEGDSWRG
jgi:hypothetical protein